ncbi:MAG TPA: YidC/Oxa1 family insertase periplasmic-domain containing protein [Planctomycetota bacterium]|nr:YidC/Oxa1 family insertase periplasmic-domain containing protein [Planctomycetota bacterium]
MAEAKKFDAVTIVGLIAAVAILIGGNLYIRAQQEAQLKAWEAQQAAEAKRLAAEQAQMKKDDSAPKLTSADPATPKATETSVTKDAKDSEVARVPDITVATDLLTLEFTADGASIRKAKLNNAFIDPAKKQQKGLEILAEIEPGKLTGAMPVFEIGPSDPAKQSERTTYAADGSQKALSQRVWKLESDSGTFDANGSRKIVYSTVLSQKYTVTKTFTVHQKKRYLNIDVNVANNSEVPSSWSYQIYGPAGVLLDGPPENPKGSPYVTIRAEVAGRDAPVQGTAGNAPDVKTVDAATAAKQTEHAWISREQNLWGTVKNRFFNVMLISLDPSQLNKLSAIEIKHKPNDPDKRLNEPNTGILGFRKTTGAYEPSKSGEDKYALYLGPTNEAEFIETEAQLQPAQPLYLVSAMQYCDIGGWRWPRVDWVASKLMWLFQRLYSVLGNYGISVIFLTMLIKLALHPTQRKATVSMHKMQQLQPEIKKLQEKYKNQTSNDARMRQYREQQDLFKSAGVSPAGGCLPMLVQIPILSALYGIFNHAFEIRGAEFLWVKDLAQPDHLVQGLLPFWPNDLNLLPIIYLGLQLMQMKLAPQAPPSDDPAVEMNRKMMLYMPVFFTFMFYTMPSGLMIYFAASAVFSIIEAWYIKKYILAAPPSGPAGGDAANAPKLRVAKP